MKIIYTIPPSSCRMLGNMKIRNYSPQTVVDIYVIRRGQHYTIPVTIGLRSVVIPKQ